MMVKTINNMGSLKLYYTEDCNYCQIVINGLRSQGVACLLLPHVAHQEEVQELGDGVVPILLDGDEIIMGSQSIVSYISRFESKSDHRDISDYKLRLYVKAGCNHCLIATNALASQGVDCLMLSQIDANDTVPMLTHGDEVVEGASNIVSYLDGHFERKTFEKVAEKPKNWNVSFVDMQIRYILASSLMIYGFLGGQETLNFSVSANHAVMELVGWMMGTLDTTVGYIVMVVGAILLWTAGRRKCPIYSSIGYATYEKDRKP